MTSWDAFQQVREIRDELLAADFALTLSIRQVEVNSNLLAAANDVIGLRQLRRCASNLESTYLLRLFSTFEGVLRDYWSAARPSPRLRRTPMETLMNRIVIRRQIPNQISDAAHKVRVYRNWLVHPQAAASRMTFEECKSRLGHFLSYLPPRW